MVVIDIEMPDNCYQCPIANDSFMHGCPIINKWSTKNTVKRLDDCPLQPVTVLQIESEDNE